MKFEERKILEKKFTMIIGHALLGYDRIKTHDNKDSYIPPSDEEVVKQYLNDPLFNRTVDLIVVHCFNALGEHQE